MTVLGNFPLTQPVLVPRTGILTLAPATGTTIAPLVLTPGKYLVGSDADCHLPIPVAGIAGRHCLILATADRVVVKAFDERTWVNEFPTRETSLRAHDRLTVGPISFRVRAATNDEVLESTVEVPVLGKAAANNVPPEVTANAVASRALPPTVLVNAPTQSAVDLASGRVTVSSDLPALSPASIRAEGVVASSALPAELERRLKRDRERLVAAKQRLASAHQQLAEQKVHHERSLADHEDRLNERIRALEHQAETLVAKANNIEAQLTEERAQLAEARTNLAEKLSAVAGQQRHYETLAAELAEKETLLEQQFAELTVREAQARSRQQQLVDEGLGLKQQLFESRSALAVERAEVEQQHRLLVDEQLKLANLSGQHAVTNASLKAREAAWLVEENSRRAHLDAERQQLDEERKRLENHQRTIAEREGELVRHRRLHDERLGDFESQQAALRSEKLRLDDELEKLQSLAPVERRSGPRDRRKVERTDPSTAAGAEELRTLRLEFSQANLQLADLQDQLEHQRKLYAEQEELLNTERARWSADAARLQESKLQQHTIELSAIAESEKRLQCQLEAANTELEQTVNELNRSVEHSTELENQKSAVDAERASLALELEAVRSAAESHARIFEQRIAIAETKAESAATALMAATDATGLFTSQLQQHASELKTLAESKAVLQHQLETASAELQRTAQELDKAVRHSAELEEQKSAVAADRDRLAIELETVQSAAESHALALEKRIAVAEADAEGAVAAATAAESEMVRQHESRIQQYTSELNALTESKALLQNELEAATAELQRTAQELDSAVRHAAELEEQKSAASAERERLAIELANVQSAAEAHSLSLEQRIANAESLSCKLEQQIAIDEAGRLAAEAEAARIRDLTLAEHESRIQQQTNEFNALSESEKRLQSQLEAASAELARTVDELSRTVRHSVELGDQKSVVDAERNRLAVDLEAIRSASESHTRKLEQQIAIAEAGRLAAEAEAACIRDRAIAQPSTARSSLAPPEQLLAISESGSDEQAAECTREPVIGRPRIHGCPPHRTDGRTLRGISRPWAIGFSTINGPLCQESSVSPVLAADVSTHAPDLAIAIGRSEAEPVFASRTDELTPSADTSVAESLSSIQHWAAELQKDLGVTDMSVAKDRDSSDTHAPIEAESTDDIETGSAPATGSAVADVADETPEAPTTFDSMVNGVLDNDRNIEEFDLSTERGLLQSVNAAINELSPVTQPTLPGLDLRLAEMFGLTVTANEAVVAEADVAAGSEQGSPVSHVEDSADEDTQTGSTVAGSIAEVDTQRRDSDVDQEASSNTTGSISPAAKTGGDQVSNLRAELARMFDLPETQSTAEVGADVSSVGASDHLPAVATGGQDCDGIASEFDRAETNLPSESDFVAVRDGAIEAELTSIHDEHLAADPLRPDMGSVVSRDPIEEDYAGDNSDVGATDENSVAMGSGVLDDDDSPDAVLSLADLADLESPAVASTPEGSASETAHSQVVEQVEEPVEEEDSIAAYMERLLARQKQGREETRAQESPKRNRASASSETPRPAPSATADGTSPIVSGRSDSAGVMATAEQSPIDPNPRHQIDKNVARASIESFRNLANNSARSALKTSSWKRQRIAFYVKVLLTVVCLGVSMVFLSADRFGGESYPLQGYGILALGVYLAIDSVIACLRLNQPVKSVKKGPRRDLLEHDSSGSPQN